MTVSYDSSMSGGNSYPEHVKGVGVATTTGSAALTFRKSGTTMLPGAAVIVTSNVHVLFEGVNIGADTSVPVERTCSKKETVLAVATTSRDAMTLNVPLIYLYCDTTNIPGSKASV